MREQKYTQLTRLFYGLCCLVVVFYSFLIPLAIAGKNRNWAVPSLHIFTENPMGTLIVIIWMFRGGKMLPRALITSLILIAAALALFIGYSAYKDQQGKSTSLLLFTIWFFGCGWVLLPAATNYCLSKFDQLRDLLFKSSTSEKLSS